MNNATHLGSRVVLGALLLVTAATMVVAVPRNAAHAASPAAHAAVLVKVARVGKFGNILVNGKGLAIYYWSKEKAGTIKCTGACATVWPPVLLPKGMNAPMHIAGAMGRVGVIMRPGGARQLTFNGRALYLYQNDTRPGQVLCDGVDGWYAYRLTH